MDDSKAEEEKEVNFNIYYLNFSKVYEIKMMIDNVIKSKIERQKGDESEATKKKGGSLGAKLGDKNANINATINAESLKREITSSKLIESLDVITTNSTLLKEIISKCKSFDKLSDCKEGDLLKIDNLKLQILDEETLRTILLLRRNALEGLSYESYEVSFDLNNLISSMLQDYSYIFKGFIDNNKTNEEDNKTDENAVIIKIPTEIENEFESKYDVSDLLIGHLSLIGIYKRVVTEDFIKRNTFTFFSNLESSKENIEPKIISSSTPENGNAKIQDSTLKSDKIEYHFIDTIALIQDVKFDKKEIIKIETEKNGILKRILEFFHNLR